MRSIKRLFEKIAKKNPYWGSVIVFNSTVSGKNFSHDRIARMFNILVDKDEYEKSDKKALLEYAYLINRPLNRTKNEGILPLREDKKAKTSKDQSNINKLVKTPKIIWNKK